MRPLSGACAVAILVTLMAASTVVAAPRSTPTPTPPITTEVWREPRVPLELHWHILALPERLVEVAFTPLAGLVILTERYRLDRRIYDLLRNDAGTIVVNPKVKLSFSDGLGGGASLNFKSLFGSEEKLEFGALTRIDRDYELSAGYAQSIAHLNGRELIIGIERGVDRNLRYYGLGNGTTSADERVLRSDYLTALTSFDINGRGYHDLTGLLELGYRHERLTTGEDSSIVGLDAGDSVALPVGFDRSHDFACVRARLRFDSRDTSGRPTRGSTAEIAVGATDEIGGAEVSALRGSFEISHYIPLLPDHRILVLSAGLASVTSLLTNDAVPLHSLVMLGRKHHLRGYNKNRFRDQHGWWAAAEYRFTVHEYLNTGIALEPIAFVDVGRVGSGFSDLFDGDDVHYSYGLGVRSAHETLVLLRAEIGFSPEGVELGFSLGKDI